MLKTQIVDGLEVFSCLPSRKTGKPALLFVHGAFAGGWMWTETFMPFLAEAGYPCYALSLRGHGGSTGGEQINWHSIGDYVDDVKTVVDWLDEPPVLIGHSMGGFIVQKYLEHRPATAVALVFLDDEAAHRVADQDWRLIQPVDHRFDVIDIVADRVPVDLFAPRAAAMAAQGEGVAGIARLGQKGHEGFRPHPAAGEGAMHEKQGRLAGLAAGQAGENFKAVDDLCF
jgi:pimeloyl-ACP methyl ester carboxylesterase